MKTKPASLTIGLAWAVTLMMSILPDILSNEFLGGSTSRLFLGKFVILVILLLSSFFWQPMKPLWSFVALWLVMFAAMRGVSHLDFEISDLQNLLGESKFVQQMQPEQFSKFFVSILVILTLLTFGYKRKQLFLTIGELNAPITPVKWMGFPQPDPWWKFGGQYGVYIPFGMVVVAWLVSKPGPGFWEKVSAALPGILLFAAMNAFNEEVTYRASMLATLESSTSYQHAWWMSAVYFGIAHFYGVPYGWMGIILATFNGWLLGKAMLETRGLFWPWWMHFLQDVTIFIFVAGGSLTPGG